MRMRPSADPRAPGIYQSFDRVAPPPLSIANTRITGFVGVTHKGPINEPTRLRNWDEFIELFGYTTDSYTSRFGLRLLQERRHRLLGRARRALPRRRASSPVLDHAACAEHVQIDDWNKPSLKIRALNEGTWGNTIWFRCAHSPGAQALLTRDLDIGAGEAHVNVTRGFEVGSLVRIYDRENSDYIVITEVGDKLVKWARRHAGQPPSSRRCTDASRGDDVRAPRRDARSPRGVQGAADASVVAKLRAARGLAALAPGSARGSRDASSPVPHNLPEVLPMTRLAGGRDGVDAITPEDFIGIDHGPGERAGLLALAANEEVALLAVPDAMRFYDREPGPAGELKAQRIQDQMIAICENQKDRFAILDIPQSKDIEWVRRWRRRTD